MKIFNLIDFIWESVGKLKRSEWLSLISFIIVCILYYVWTWSPILSHRGGDNAYYLLTAQYYSPYSNFSEVAEYFATHNVYPPLYPLLLGLFGGGDSILIAHIITTTFLLLAFAVYFLWLKKETFSLRDSLSLVFLFSLLPGTYMQSLSVHSENLYLLLSLLTYSCALRVCVCVY